MFGTKKTRIGAPLFWSRKNGDGINLLLSGSFFTFLAAGTVKRVHFSGSPVPALLHHKTNLKIETYFKDIQKRGFKKW